MVTWHRAGKTLPSGHEAMVLSRVIDNVHPCSLKITASSLGITVEVVRERNVGRQLGVFAIFRQRAWLEAWLDDRDRMRLANLRDACSEAWSWVETYRANLSLAPVRGSA